MTVVHVVVPEGIDDPTRPSGGNTYDRRVCDGLASLGWALYEHAVPGGWPRPDAAAFAALAGIVGHIPDDSVVLLDGLVACTAPDILVPQASRLRLVVLVHMPLGHRPPGDGDARARERAVLSAAAAVVTTSAWSRRRLMQLYGLSAGQVHVARPGVDPADGVSGSEAAGALLCVAAVTFDKGHDVLLDALTTISHLPWHCVCVGSLERDPPFVESLRERAGQRGLDGRIEFAGPRTGGELDCSYAAADLMVLASRAETYGMVVADALARGLPIVASDVGGLTEALGSGADRIRPGLLVPPSNPVAFAGALRSWLSDAELRRRLRRAARERRQSLPSWETATAVIAGVLAGVSR